MDSEGLRSRFRGQGSTEYLVILGAVLLVSLVVVSATSSFSSSQVSMKQQQSQAYWSSLSPIKVLSSKVVDNNLILQVQNTGTSTIRLDGVNVGGVDLPIYPYYSGDYYGTAYCSRPNDNFTATMTCALMIGAGESVYVTAQGAISGSSPAVDCAGKTGIELSDVRFLYSTSGSSITNLLLKGDKPLVTSCGAKACDTYWIKVPGNSSMLVNDFCLMKYEAKQSGSIPVSNWSGTPWTVFSGNTAAARCSLLGQGYHLVRDREWIALAYNIAGNPANWFTANAGASSGSQCLFGGHMECNGAPCNALFNASSDDSQGYWNGTSNASVSLVATCPFSANEGRGYETRRTMFLQTGEAIWDLSGNVIEFTDGTIDSMACSNGTMPAPCTTSQWLEYTAITNYNSANWSRLPNSAWNSNYGAGKIYVDSDCGIGNEYTPQCDAEDNRYHAFQRGGFFNYAYNAGIWSLYLGNSPTFADDGYGFRCAR